MPSRPAGSSSSSTTARRKTKNGMFAIDNEFQARAVGREFAQRVFMNQLQWHFVFEATGNGVDNAHPFVLYDLVDKTARHYSVRIVTQARGNLGTMQQLLANPLNRQQMLANLLQEDFGKGLLLADFGTKTHETGERENVDVQLMKLTRNRSIGSVGGGFENHVMLGYTLETSLERCSKVHKGVIKTFPSVIHLTRRVQFTQSPLAEAASSAQDFALTFIIQETENQGTLRIEVFCSTDCVTTECRQFMQMVVQRLVSIENELRLFECLRNRYASGQVGASIPQQMPTTVNELGRRSQNMSDLSTSASGGAGSNQGSRRSTNASLLEAAYFGSSDAQEYAGPTTPVRSNHVAQPFATQPKGDRMSAFDRPNSVYDRSGNTRSRASTTHHKSSGCAVCGKSFNAFRWKYTCESCHQSVCNSCYSVIANPTTRTRKKKVCNVCLYDRSKTTANGRRTTRGNSAESDARTSGASMRSQQQQAQVHMQDQANFSTGRSSRGFSVDSHCSNKSSNSAAVSQTSPDPRPRSPSAAPALSTPESKNATNNNKEELLEHPLSVGVRQPSEKSNNSHHSLILESPSEETENGSTPPSRRASRSNSNPGASRLTVSSTTSSRDSVLLDDEMLRSLDRHTGGKSISKKSEPEDTKCATVNVFGDCAADYELDFDWFNIFPKAPLPADESKRLKNLLDMGLNEEAHCLQLGNHFDVENSMQQVLRMAFVTDNKPAFNGCRVNIVTKDQVVCIKKLMLLGNGEIVEEVSSAKSASTARLESASSYAVYYNQPFFVEDLAKDERLCAHPVCVDDDAVVMLSVPLYSSASKQQQAAKCIGTIDLFQTTHFESDSGLTLSPIQEMMQLLNDEPSKLENIEQVVLELGVSLENIARQNATKRLFKSPLKNKPSLSRPAAMSTSSCSSNGSGSTRREDSFELDAYDLEFDHSNGSPTDPTMGSGSSSHGSGSGSGGRAGGQRLSSVQQLESLLNQINQTSDLLRRTTLGGSGTAV